MNAAEIIDDPLIRAIVLEFHRKFANRGGIAWVVDSSGKLVFASSSPVAQRVAASVPPIELPNVGVEDIESRRLILIDAVNVRGVIDHDRRMALARQPSFGAIELVFVSAFRSRSELALMSKPPWGTSAWFANEPDHSIEFNGGRMKSPH